MVADIERRLAEAAEALREHEVVVDRCADLQNRATAMEAALVGLREQLTAEQKDLQRLEGMSFTRLLLSLRAGLDDALARERAQATAARYRVTEAETNLRAVRRELHAAEARRKYLASAPSDFAAVLDDKERYLIEAADPNAQPLLALAEERGRLRAELRELDEATQAARAALDALGSAQEALCRVSGWEEATGSLLLHNTRPVDGTFFGGGAFDTTVARVDLDDAATATAAADRCLVTLRTELADIPEIRLAPSRISVAGLTGFTDAWCDALFTDLEVWKRLGRVRSSVAAARRMVCRIHDRLDERTARATARIAEIATERRDLLTG